MLKKKLLDYSKYKILHTISKLYKISVITKELIIFYDFWGYNSKTIEITFFTVVTFKVKV